MQAILKSTDRPLVETVRATLETEGIAVVVQGDVVRALPFLPMIVLVADDDVATARELIRKLVTPVEIVRVRSARRWGHLLLIAVLLIVAIVCGTLIIG